MSELSPPDLIDYTQFYLPENFSNFSKFFFDFAAQPNSPTLRRNFLFSGEKIKMFLPMKFHSSNSNSNPIPPHSSIISSFKKIYSSIDLKIFPIDEKNKFISSSSIEKLKIFSIENPKYFLRFPSLEIKHYNSIQSNYNFINLFFIEISFEIPEFISFTGQLKISLSFIDFLSEISSTRFESAISPETFSDLRDFASFHRILTLPPPEIRIENQFFHLKTMKIQSKLMEIPETSSFSMENFNFS